MVAADPGRIPVTRLLWRVARFELGEALRRSRKRLGLLKLLEVTPADCQAPDSQIARDAFELASRLSSRMLLNHAVRTYHYGAILAARDGLRIDRELLYVASVLHDLGLTPMFQNEPGSFEWVSATQARDFGVERGMDADRADLLFDAVALHSSIGIADSREPEVAMVHFGAGLDLFGLRLDEVPKLEVSRILEEWPRCEFKKDFPSCVEYQCQLKPRSHIAGAMALGLGKRIRDAPFPE